MREIWEEKNDAEGAADLSTAIYTCAVLLRDFKEKLSEKAVAGCGEMVQEVVTQWLQSDSDYLLSSAIEAVLPEIVRWVSCEDLSADWENPLYWVIGILLEHRGGDIFVLYCEYFVETGSTCSVEGFIHLCTFVSNLSKKILAVWENRTVKKIS